MTSATWRGSTDGPHMPLSSNESTTVVLPDAAAYLDDVAAALGAAGIRTSSIEIDARRPLTGRLVVTRIGHPEVLVLDWHRDKGWRIARRARAGARPKGWRLLSGDPAARPTDVVGQFQHALHAATDSLPARPRHSS